jgi:hypothetical protein
MQLLINFLHTQGLTPSPAKQRGVASRSDDGVSPQR